MKLFNYLYILCLIGLIGAFCGANFGLSYLTDRLRCALNYDLRVDMKINDDGTGADLGDLPVDAEEGANGAGAIGASPALKFPQFHISGVENLAGSGNAGEMMSTILKQITEKLNGTDELLNLEDKLQRRVQSLFADERMRDTVMRNLGSSNSLDLLRGVIDERYLTTAVHDTEAQRTSTGAADGGLLASLLQTDLRQRRL